MKKLALLITICFAGSVATAQNSSTDSAQVAKAFTELLSICKHVDFADPKTQEVGMFYKAGKYIVYRGEDTKRKWKDTANYANQTEKNQVDGFCLKVNGTLNQASEYNIVGYRTQKESEGTWHGLVISYTRKGVKKNAIYGFLKVKGIWALGDID